MLRHSRPCGGPSGDRKVGDTHRLSDSRDGCDDIPGDDARRVDRGGRRRRGANFQSPADPRHHSQPDSAQQSCGSHGDTSRESQRREFALRRRCRHRAPTDRAGGDRQYASGVIRARLENRCRWLAMQSGRARLHALDVQLCFLAQHEKARPAAVARRLRSVPALLERERPHARHRARVNGQYDGRGRDDVRLHAGAWPGRLAEKADAVRSASRAGKCAHASDGAGHSNQCAQALPGPVDPLSVRAGYLARLGPEWANIMALAPAVCGLRVSRARNRLAGAPGFSRVFHRTLSHPRVGLSPHHEALDG